MAKRKMVVIISDIYLNLNLMILFSNDYRKHSIEEKSM